MPEIHDDLSFEEVGAQVDPLIANGATIFFKYTCGGCGERKMFEEPNTLYEEARCEECGHLTNLRESGVGYMLVLSGRVGR